LEISKKKIALIIIALGIFINILALPFVQHYNQHAGFIGSLGRMEVVLLEETERPDADLNQKMRREIFGEPANEGRVAFPYRYVFFISVLLVFAGCVLIILTPETKSGKETNTDPAMRQRPWFKIGGVFLAWLLLYIFLKELWPTGWVLRSMIAPIVFFVIYKLWNQNTDSPDDVVTTDKDKINN
jgi:uncharacterized membrane protein